MKKLCLYPLAALLGTVPLQPAQASGLLGMWTENGGPGAARIAPCGAAADQLCATGYDRNPDGSVGRKRAVVLRDLKPDGKNRWRGTYLDGSRKLPATVTLVAKGKVSMRVCLLILCQTVSYTRIGD
ncbi:MAG: hypothetical protein NBV68_06100 [Erythrobacter sp.]|uniref:hypothetical protein n=1 Tax=Erythrobacter sp. TaxID=1042 RepID=UPI0025E2298F|nr:hypothetical protein [Erythrobacter sp.]MCL9998934.1 hypothetical protein [Erythrobacter sp.]